MALLEFNFILLAYARLIFIPTILVCGLQYWLCKNNPKKKRIIPMISLIGGAIILLGLLFMSRTILTSNLMITVKLFIMELMISFLPLFVLILVTKFTKVTPSYKDNELNKMKINDL